MNKSTAVFNEAKKNLVNTRSRLARNAKMLDAHRSLISSVLRKVGLNKSDDMNAYVVCSWGTVEIRLALHKLDSFKDSRLLAVLDVLEDLNPRNVECSEWADYVEKTFTYKYDRYEVKVEAVVRSDSDSCRRVVDSVELVEQLKYKIVCD